MCREWLLTGKNDLIPDGEMSMFSGNFCTSDYHSLATQLARSDCVEFYKCCISNAMNGTDMLCSDTEEARNGTDRCEIDEGTECKDGHPTNNEGEDSDTDL